MKRKSTRQHPLHRHAQEYAGFAVKTLRGDRAWTQEVLATKAGISVRTLYRIERGETPATLATLAAISIALDEPMQTFVPGYSLMRTG